MYLAQLIQTVIFPTENFIEPDWMNPLSKILQIPNFKIFASNHFSTFQVIFNQNSETPKVYNRIYKNYNFQYHKYYYKAIFSV